MKAEATRLHSKIVRQLKGPRCQNCDRVATDCAHIVGRVFSHTRTDVNNAFALCAQCHRHFTNWHGDWMDFVYEKIGRNAYAVLVHKARAGVGVSLDWYSELDRLKVYAEKTGVSWP